MAVCASRKHPPCVCARMYPDEDEEVFHLHRSRGWTELSLERWLLRLRHRLAIGKALQVALTVMGCHGLSWDVMGCHGLSWAVMGCHGLSWAVMGCHGLSWAAMGCHGLSWGVAGCDGVGCGGLWWLPAALPSSTRAPCPPPRPHVPRARTALLLPTGLRCSKVSRAFISGLAAGAWRPWARCWLRTVLPLTYGLPWPPDHLRKRPRVGPLVSPPAACRCVLTAATHVVTACVLVSLVLCPCVGGGGA
jgi:hypothetical protein